MKKLTLFLSAVIMIAFAAPAIAQNGGQQNGNRQGQRQRMSFSERMEQRLESLTKDLSLTEEQVKKTKALNTKFDKKFQELQNNSGSTPEERRAQRGKYSEVMDAYNTEFKGILTDEQKVKYDKLQEERRRRFEQRRGQGPPNGERPQRRQRPE